MTSTSPYPTSVGTFKGRPTLTVRLPKGKPFTFGLAKARALLAVADVIQAFVDSDGAPEGVPQREARTPKPKRPRQGQCPECRYWCKTPGVDCNCDPGQAPAVKVTPRPRVQVQATRPALPNAQDQVLAAIQALTAQVAKQATKQERTDNAVAHLLASLAQEPEQDDAPQADAA